MNTTRILIVEDEAITAMGIRKMLEKRGYEVVGIAASGEEAISLAEGCTPHLVLMDILLDSAMDGIEAAHRIMSRQRIPIIFITAHSDEATLTRAKATEPHGYMLKPINQHDLFSSIELALYKHSMEMRLRESEEKYRLLAENSLDVIWTMNLDGTFTYVSPSVELLSGFTPEEVLRMPLREYIGSFYDEVAGIIATELLKPPAERAQSRQMELQQISKSGGPVDIEVKVSWLCDNAGTPLGVQGITRDISDRKRAERAVQESEEKYHTLFNSMSDAVVILDPGTGEIIEANQTMLDLFGTTMVELRASSLEDYLTGVEPFTPDSARQVLRGVMDGGPNVVEWSVRKKSGGSFWVELTLSPVTIDGMRRVIANIRDMTRQKTDEEELQRKNRELRRTVAQSDEHNQILQDVQDELTEIQTFLLAAIEQSPAGIIIVNAGDLSIRYINQAAMTIGGTEHIPAPNVSYLDYRDITMLHEADRSPYRDDERPLYRAVMHGEETRDLVSIIRLADGTELTLLTNALPIRNHQKTIIAGILFLTDISEMWDVTRELEEKRRFIERAAEAIPGILFVVDLQGPHNVYTNRDIRRILGYTPDEVRALGDTLLGTLMHPDDTDAHLAYAASFTGTADGVVRENEYRMKRADGSWLRIHEWTTVFSRHADGRPRELLGIAQDITELRRMAEQLKLHEERLALALDAVNDGVFDWNLRTGEMYQSPRWFTMLGYAPGEVNPGIESWQALIHPDDRNNALDLLMPHSLDQRGEFEVEYRMMARDRQWRWVLARGKVVERNESGVPVRMVGTHMDITERKHAGEQVTASLRRVRRQQQAVVTLATNGAVAAGQIDEAFRLITETAARALHITRASIWLIDDEGANFTCCDLYNASSRTHGGGITYPLSRFPEYFAALADGRAIDAHDAITDPRTAGTAEAYLIPFDIRSLLDAPIRAAGRLAGIVSFEQTGRQRAWEPDEVTFAGEVADQVAQVLTNRDRGLAEERLRASLGEKEMLLTEIHHRVKNNLQIISSLLSLQAMQIRDEKTRQLFRISQDRIRSMALIHEKLYRSHNFTSVNFEDYARELVDELRQSYADRMGNLTVVIDVPGTSLSIDRAVPCGLILTELVTNAMKYAFPDGGAGTIGVSLKGDGAGNEILSVHDTGRGLPSEISLPGAGTLGLQLVATLVQQLKGSTVIKREGGTRFVITFPNPA